MAKKTLTDKELNGYLLYFTQNPNASDASKKAMDWLRYVVTNQKKDYWDFIPVAWYVINGATKSPTGSLVVEPPDYKELKDTAYTKLMKAAYGSGGNRRWKNAVAKMLSQNYLAQYQPRPSLGQPGPSAWHIDVRARVDQKTGVAKKSPQFSWDSGDILQTLLIIAGGVIAFELFQKLTGQQGEVTNA